MTIKSIEKIRRWKELKAADVAERLGMSERQYRRYEQGETDWTLELLEQMAGILQMSVPEMIGFDERLVFNHCSQKHVLGSHNTYHETSDKERELYEARIKHLEDEVAYLRKQLELVLAR